MSRGGRRGGGGAGRKRGGPDLSWEDDEDDVPSTPLSTKPEELFPAIHLPVPRPPTKHELARVKRTLEFNARTRKGPYYSTFDPSSVADKETGKFLKRAGFDPFNDQDRYTTKYHTKKRAVPDLSTRNYELSFFPHELWPLLDPQRKSSLWKSADIDIDIKTNAPKQKPLKRKRDDPQTGGAGTGDKAGAAPVEAAEDDGNDTDDSDPLSSSRRGPDQEGAKRAKKAKAAQRRRDKDKNSHEKRGLDIEDEFDDHEMDDEESSAQRKERNKRRVDDDDSDDDDEQQQRQDDDKNPRDNQGEEGEDVDEEDDDDDEEPVDSEFEESDDGSADDYNAENYFDTGEGDEDDGFAFGAGGDEGGEYF